MLFSHKLMLASAAAVVGLSMAAPGVLARDPPPGPYRQECRHERVEDGWLLRATCRRNNGEWRDSSLDLRTCPPGSMIVNRDAYLHCAEARGDRWDRDGYRDGYRRANYELPRGPYRAECRRERIEDGYLLRATCPKSNGEMRDASLDLRDCGRDPIVYNDGAYLRCR